MTLPGQLPANETTGSTFTAAQEVAVETAVNLDTVAIQSGAKLVSIGDQGWGLGQSPNATSTTGTSEMIFKVGVTASNVTAEWIHWYTATLLDTDPSGSISFNASLKVVSSTNPGTTVGTIYRMTFGGRTTATLDPGGRSQADLLGVSVAQGDVVAIRTYLSSGTAYPVRPTYGTYTSQGGFVTGDLTAPGSAAITPTTGNYFGPSNLLGYPQNGRSAKSVVLLGDSIAAAIGEDALLTQPALGLGGFGVRALYGVGGLLDIAQSGDTASSFLTTNGSFHRLTIAGKCNTAIIEYGTNDIANGAAATALQANLLGIAQNLRRLGIAKVFLVTISPRTTSTDNWATLVNQTPLTTEPQRIAHNAWVRAGCPINGATLAPVAVGTSGALLAGSFGHPVTGFFDTAGQTESSFNSGLWAPALRTTTGSITASQTTITAPSANFNSAIQENGGDVGLTVVVVGAGTSGANLSTIIFSVTSSTQAVLSPGAATTVSGAQFVIGTMTTDGAHPTGRGHNLMAQAINTALL
jgi:lysophospholipase L1-like esterase